jgi:deoxyribodipyrimidine photo-lyase
MDSVEEIALAPTAEGRRAQMRALFPQLEGQDCSIAGGRAAAVARLNDFDAAAYAQTRNHIDGGASGLSPYLRHGVVTLAEAARHVIGRFGNAARKFVSELGWRDYFRRVWAARGDDIHQAIESPKVAIGGAPLPEDIKRGATGLACMDAFVQQLQQTGYLHNHARMWFASYVIHLSWQWIGSTFSAKPYLFDRGNLSRFTNDRYCQGCARAASCPFEARPAHFTPD